MDLRTGAAWAAVAVIGALSVGGLAAETRRGAQVPGEGAIRAAAARVTAGFTTGDSVVVRPAWDEAPWAALAGLGPGADDLPHAALLRGGMVDPVDLARHARVWVVSGYDEPREPPGLADGDYSALEVWQGEGLSVGLFQLTSARPLATLTGALEELAVSRLASNGATTPCPRKRTSDPRTTGFECGAQGWLDPHVERRDVFHRPVSWLYAHPGPGDGALVLEWASAPRGAAVIVRAGLTQSATRHDVGSAAEVAVWLDGEERDRFTLAPHEYWLERRLLAPASHPDGLPLTLRVEVRAEDPRWREVMLEVDVFGNLTESLRQAATGP